MSDPTPDPAADGRTCPRLILLPHTGIRAPHHSVRDLRHHVTGSVIAYHATLCLDGQPVGRIVNPRTTSHYRPRPDSPCTSADLDAFAHQCRDHTGAPMSVDAVLTALVDESDTAEHVADLVGKGETPARLQRSIGDSLVSFVPFGISVPADGGFWPPVLAALLRRRPAQEDESYQVWHADAWLTLTLHPGQPNSGRGQGRAA